MQKTEEYNFQQSNSTKILEKIFGFFVSEIRHRVNQVKKNKIFKLYTKSSFFLQLKSFLNFIKKFFKFKIYIFITKFFKIFFVKIFIEKKIFFMYNIIFFFPLQNFLVLKKITEFSNDYNIILQLSYQN